MQLVRMLLVHTRAVVGLGIQAMVEGVLISMSAMMTVTAVMLMQLVGILLVRTHAVVGLGIQVMVEGVLISMSVMMVVTTVTATRSAIIQMVRLRVSVNRVGREMALSVWIRTSV